MTALAIGPSGRRPDGDRIPPAAAPGRRPTRGCASGRDDYLSRLPKIEGQVRGLQRMMEAGTWCPGVVIQVSSATQALQEVAVGQLNDHLHHYVLETMRNSDAGEESLAEVASTIRHVIRL
jgi:DNA-binding FrmR family transcriptional regulator